jgi:hypothetical protein
MSAGQGSISFENLPPQSPAGITAANEGLYLNGSTVQLGAPDTGQEESPLTVERYIYLGTNSLRLVDSYNNFRSLGFTLDNDIAVFDYDYQATELRFYPASGLEINFGEVAADPGAKVFAIRGRLQTNYGDGVKSSGIWELGTLEPLGTCTYTPIVDSYIMVIINNTEYAIPCGTVVCE